MAASQTFERQTKCLMDFLLQEESEKDCDAVSFRCMPTETTEQERAMKALAHQFRAIGDQLEKETVANFTKDFHKLVQEKALDKGINMFSDTVKAISSNWVTANDLSAEKNLLKVMVSLGVQASKQVPSLIKEIGEAMTSFSNTSLKDWVTSQGGWENIDLN